MAAADTGQPARYRTAHALVVGRSGVTEVALADTLDDARGLAAALLWAAARPDPDVDAVAAAVDAGADLELVVVESLVQRIGPLVYRALQAAERAHLLPDADLQLDHDIRRAQAELMVPIALQTALGPLAEHDIEPLVFKGPMMAVRYPHPGLRPMDDLDVIVHPDQYDRALVALLDAGWRTVEKDHGARYDSYLVHDRVPDYPLELHWDVETWRDRASGRSGEDLWSLRVPVELEGVVAFGLPPEDELVALAVHAGKPFHQFNRLLWSVDFAVLIGAAPDLDFDRVMQIASSVGADTVVRIALAHAQRLGADVPEGLADLQVSASRREALSLLLDETWPVRHATKNESFRIRYASCDSTRKRVQLLTGAVTDQGGSGAGGMLRIVAKVPRRWWQLRSGSGD